MTAGSAANLTTPEHQVLELALTQVGRRSDKGRPIQPMILNEDEKVAEVINPALQTRPPEGCTRFLRQIEKAVPEGLG